jgi:RNA polymerase sigma factor (sigma-70 family)
VPFLKNITSSPLSDGALVEAFQQSGDVAILGTLYERYMDLVYGVCLNYLKDSEQAKDSVLQIFEELIGKVQKHDIENFKPWLYQVAKNHCLMQLRAGKKFVKAAVDVSSMQKEEPLHLNGVLEGEEKMAALQHCLAQLNAEQRQVVELFYLQGKSYKEIAPLMGIDVNGVRSFLQNGRRNLKICMDKKITVA